MQALGCLTTLLFGIVIAVLVAIINILRTVFAIKKRFTGNTSSNQGKTSNRGTSGRSQDEPGGKQTGKKANGRQRVFEDGEGDYVDFEELPK